MQRINPCRVVRNYFDLESKIDFVVYSAQTLALIFENSFICIYLYACSVPLEIIVTLLWPVALHYSLHLTLSPLPSSLLSPSRSLPPALPY